MPIRQPRSRRFTKRLEATFSSGVLRFRGISSDLSESGLFIRTHNGLMPGSIVDMELYLADEKVCRLKGIVRRTVKTPLATVKNGMGIELIEKDQLYLDFLRGFDADAEKPKEDTTSHLSPAHVQETKRETENRKGREESQRSGNVQAGRESVIVACSSCNAKNRVPKGSLAMQPRCGRCGEELHTKDIN